jgi:hypothetical protein
MSGKYVQRLLNPADSLNVLLEIPVRCNDLLKNVLGPTARDAGGVVQNYEHVPAADRVTYFDLRVDNFPSLHLNLVTESQQASATFKSGTFFKTAKSLRPCHYLPYRKNGTTRMKLAPPPGYAGDEISFFATATIDGCSVYVEGPPATPKVSHLNAAHVSPTPTAPETDVAKQARITNKVADMDARMNLIKKGPATVVERPNYVEDFAPGQAAAKQRFATSKGIPVAQVLSYEPFGAVVGVRSGGNWKFYLQKNGAFSYRMTPTAKQQSAYMVLSASEFWPNNTGGFRVL